MQPEAALAGVSRIAAHGRDARDTGIGCADSVAQRLDDIFERVWDFSGDEMFCGLAAAVFAVFSLGKLFFAIFGVHAITRRTRLRRVALAAAILLALLFLYGVLKNWSDPVNVRGHADYIFLFMVCGAAWIGGVIFLISLAGYGVRDDAIERDNPAAVIVTIGAIFGFMLVYAGANIGYGPTIWTTLVPAALASAALLAVWIVFEWVTRSAEAVLLDRDPATALRVAGFLIAGGGILGRAVAGDWTGWDLVWRDLVSMGWPVLAVAVEMAVITPFQKPTPTRLRPAIFNAGIVPAVVAMMLAAGWIIHCGPLVRVPHPAMPEKVEE